MFASAHDFPKFVKVGDAMYHELRKVGTSRRSTGVPPNHRLGFVAARRRDRDAR